MNYIEAVEAKRIQITLTDRIVCVSRLPLFQHYMLKSIHKNISESNGIDRLNSIFEYIELACDIKDLHVQDIPMLLNSLIELNEDIELLPWQVTYRLESRRTNIEYEHREITVMINMLARNYGWSQEFILSLQPEVVACYVQEILLDDWHEKEYNYKLSAVAYDEKGKYKPFDKPDWYTELVGPTEEEAKGMIPSKFVPDGVIIDYTKNQQQKN